MTTCTRRLTFAAGHRIAGHEGKCRHLHGHNYTVFITAQADELDSLGRVIDFGVIKQRVGGWIDENWDHGLILWTMDTKVQEAARLIPGQKLYQIHANPTAENLAKFLLGVADDLLANTGVRVVKVVLWETENCFAEAT